MEQRTILLPLDPSLARIFSVAANEQVVKAILQRLLLASCTIVKYTCDAFPEHADEIAESLRGIKDASLHFLPVSSDIIDAPRRPAGDDGPPMHVRPAEVTLTDANEILRSVMQLTCTLTRASGPDTTNEPQLRAYRKSALTCIIGHLEGMLRTPILSGNAAALVH